MSFKRPRGFGNKLFKTWARKTKTEIFVPFETEDDQFIETDLTELVRKVGDERTAKRVQELQAQYPVGTIPELVTYDWLTRGGWRFVYQAQLYGGRGSSGGLLPDFVVETGAGEGMAWQIQGEYWHGKSAEKGVSDAEAALRLTGQTVGGIRIDKVLGLWERDVLDRRPDVFKYAIAGISLR